MNPERRTIIFSGRVQGVGFRMTTVHIARDLPLSGTVRNLPDSSVEVAVQGSPEDIDTLIDRLREHFGSFIRTVQQTRGSAFGSPPPGIRVDY